MTDVLKSVKKIFTVSVVGATVAWALGLAAFVAPAVANAAVCPAFVSGDNIKVTGRAAIYAVDNLNHVRYYPSGDEWKSWTEKSATAANQYEGYISVTQECFDSLSVPSTYPGAVNFRPGSYVLKRVSSDKLYVVEPGNTLAEISPADATALYGSNYRVMTIQDAFWPHYVNRGVTVAGKVHEGMLVSSEGKTWYVAANNVVREVTASGMTGNRFKTAFVHTVPASYLAGTTVGTPLTAADPVVSNRTQDGATPSTPTGGMVNVSLAADNPAAGNIADGSAYNKVLKLNLSAGSAAQVTGITLTKTGLIANSNITGVSVWDSQGNRHGDVMSSLTSDNKVTVSFGSNPIVLGAGSSDTLTVAVNIAAAANSGLVGFSVASAADVMSNGTVAGSFPIVGNQMAIIDGNASLGAVTVSGVAVGGSATQPASTAAGNLNIGDMQKELAKFQFTETSGNEDVKVSSLTFYIAGTVQDNDIANWTVVAPDNTVLGTSAAMSNRYVTVKFATPYVVPKSTNRVLTVRGDVMNGSTHALKVNLQSDYDMMLQGVTTGFYILPTNFGPTSSTNGWFNMGSGTLTLNKAATSPSGQVSSGAQNVVLAKFDAKCTGENCEVRKFGLSVDTLGTTGPSKNLTGNLLVRDANDGTVYLTVAASTAALYTGGQQFSLSSYLNLPANQTKTLEVVGNIDSTATGSQKYKIGIGNAYIKRLSTLDFVDNQPTATNSSTVGNQLTVNPTALSCFKDTSFGNSTLATGATSVVGQYVCTAGSSEDVRLSNVSVSFGGTGVAANSYQNLSLWDASVATPVQLGSTISVTASTSNNFNFDLTVAKSQTKILQLKAYIVPGTSGYTLSSSVASANYVGKDSNNSGSLSSAVTGQTITVGSGYLNITALTDPSRIYGPGANAQLARIKAVAGNAGVTLSKLTFTSVYAGSKLDATTIGTFGTMSLYEEGSATALATANWVNGDVVFTGFTSAIPMNGNKTYVLKGIVNGSGVLTSGTSTAFVVKSDSDTDMVATADSGTQLGTADVNFNSASNGGPAETRFATSTVAIFYDAYPVLSALSVGSTVLPVDSQAKIFRFSVTNAGNQDLRVGTSTVNVSITGLAAADSVSSFKLWTDNGSGNVGTLLAENFSVTSTSSTNSTNVSFGTANQVGTNMAASSDYLRIAPGATKTFIVTANTLSATANKDSGTINLSAKISGTTGWNPSTLTWNTGNLFYYYTPITGPNANVEQGPYSASDSYEVTGPTLVYTS